VAIARALAVQPRVLLADEPVSMLDVSVRLGLLNLLADLRDRDHLAILYVTHDIGSARYLADTIMVMYAGKLVEVGAERDPHRQPGPPYTQLLLSAAPDPDARSRRAGRKRCAAEPDLPPERMPFPSPLPPRHGDLQPGGTARRPDLVGARCACWLHVDPAQRRTGSSGGEAPPEDGAQYRPGPCRRSPDREHDPMSSTIHEEARRVRRTRRTGSWVTAFAASPEPGRHRGEARAAHRSVSPDATALGGVPHLASISRMCTPPRAVPYGDCELMNRRTLTGLLGRGLDRAVAACGSTSTRRRHRRRLDAGPPLIAEPTTGVTFSDDFNPYDGNSVAEQMGTRSMSRAIDRVRHPGPTASGTHDWLASGYSFDSTGPSSRSPSRRHQVQQRHVLRAG